MDDGGLEKLALVDPSPSPDAVYARQKRLLHWKQGLESS
jgi:hypothetical protein